MGSGGGAVYMGAAYQLLAGGLRESLALSGRIGLSTGRTTIKDTPLLIKMLSVEAEGVAGEARKTLAILAGRDLGAEPGPWKAWWRGQSQALLAHEADCRRAGELFHGLKRDVVTGHWAAVHERLSTELQGRLSAAEAERRLAGLSAVLRKAYRDAEIAGVRLDDDDGDGGALLVDWGVAGFAFDELPLVREAGGWRFASPPWADEVIHCPPKAIEARGPLKVRKRRKSVFDTWLKWGPAIGVLAALLAIIQLIIFRDRWLFFVPNRVSGMIMKFLFIVVPIGVCVLLLVTLIYVVFIRPLPNSRELRRGLRRKRK